MSDWHYSSSQVRVQEITNLYLRELIADYEAEKPYFTEEAVYYIRTLISPIFERLNDDHTGEYAVSMPYYVEGDGVGDFDHALRYVIFDRNNRYLTQGESIDVTPWTVVDHINQDISLREFYHPPPVVVDVIIDLNHSRLPLTRDQILGVMAVYRYLHRNHPISMYRFPFAREVDEVNRMAVLVVDMFIEYYEVKVGNDVYRFTNKEFFQGLLTGAQWNYLDPHNFITDLTFHQTNTITNLQY